MRSGIRRLIRRSDGDRRCEVRHRRARYRFPVDKVRISLSTLYKLAQEGRVPCQKVGRHWRFRKQAIDRWLEHGGADGANSEGEGT